MDKYEMELLKMIREDDAPDEAMRIAIKVITDYLKQPGSFAEQAVYDHPGSA